MSTATTTAPKATTTTVTITGKRLPTWRSGLVTGWRAGCGARPSSVLPPR